MNREIDGASLEDAPAQLNCDEASPNRQRVGNIVPTRAKWVRAEPIRRGDSSGALISSLALLVNCAQSKTSYYLRPFER